MFVGHLALGVGVQRWTPRTPLALLVLAPTFLDLLWPLFLVLGLESVQVVPGITVVTPLDLHDYPYSHSLVMALVWSALVAGLYRLWRPADRRGPLWLGGLVFSHWVLDFVTHAPDLPLWPGSEHRVGLGLWNSLPGTLAVESALWLGGIALYVGATRPRDRAGSIAWWAFVGFLTAVYVGAVFGPPPPSARAVAVGAFAAWLFVPWAAYIERHRAPRAAGAR